MCYLDNATRSCSYGGVWAPTTDYNDCMCNSTEPCNDGRQDDHGGALEISIIIYLVGILTTTSHLFIVHLYIFSQAMSCLSLLCVGQSLSSFHSGIDPGLTLLWFCPMLFAGRCGAYGIRYIWGSSVLLVCQLWTGLLQSLCQNLPSTSSQCLTRSTAPAGSLPSSST